MTSFFDTEIILSITLGLCILLTMRSVYLSMIMKKQRNRLQTTTSSLAHVNKELDELRSLEHRFNSFKDDLNNAKLFTKVEKSRPLFNQRTKEHQIPERYQYVNSLHQRGVDAPEIASILTISTYEANQLVALASLSGNK